MKIFDELIKKTYGLLPNENISITNFEDVNPYIGRRSELILGKEALYELGGSGLSCSVYNLYTQDSALVKEDEVVICGNDIKDIKNDCSFAKITIVRTDDIEQNGEQGAYDILESINLRKYDVFAKGYMVRISALSNREQVRVGKAAIKAKLSFAHVGKMYIDQFKRNPHVKAVKIIFVTLPEANYLEFDRIAMVSSNLFKAMNHVIADIKMDCSHCDWKALCDAVDGMKEMHQQMIKESNKK